MRISSLLILGSLLLAPGAQALGLFGLLRDAGGPVQDALIEIDPATGGAQVVAALPNRVWEDLAGRPGDESGVYSVARIPGAAFLNQVSRLDTTTGAINDLFSFTATDLGFDPALLLELSGISFLPGQSSQAIVSATLIDIVNVGLIEAVFALDIDTGAFSDLKTVTTSARLGDLTHGPGAILLGKVKDSQITLADVDFATGAINEIGPGGLGIRSIDFDPESGQLFGVDVFGNLVELSPTTAQALQSIGPSGLAGSINGLAFVVPEPSTGLLTLAGLGILSRTRRRASRG